MSDTPELDELLNENAARRGQARAQAQARAAEAADLIDRIAHPGESDHDRQKRRDQEAERARLASLGVSFDG